MVVWNKSRQKGNPLILTLHSLKRSRQSLNLKSLELAAVDRNLGICALQVVVFDAGDKVCVPPDNPHSKGGTNPPMKNEHRSNRWFDLRERTVANTGRARVARGVNSSFRK